VQAQGEESGQCTPDPGSSVVPIASSGLVFRHGEGFIVSLESVLNHAVAVPLHYYLLPYPGHFYEELL